MFGKPKVLKIGDQCYELYPLKLDDFAELQAWINSQYRSPLDIVREDFAKAPDYWNMTRQEFALRTAIEKATAGAPRIGSPAADALLLTHDGQAVQLYLSIRKGKPEFTLDDARKLVVDNAAGMHTEILSATNADMVMHDPKGPRPTGSERGNSTSRPSRKATRASKSGR